MRELVNPTIPYVAERHPLSTSPAEILTAPLDGGNCELFVHGVTLARGYRLPTVRSSELYADNKATDPLEVDDTLGILQTGDIIGMGRENQVGFRGIHVGLIVRRKSGLHVVHNDKLRQRVRVEPLETATEDPRHARVVWAKRPKLAEFNPRLYHPKDLEKINLEMLAA